MKKPVILCVDDDRTVLDSLKEQLKILMTEYAVETAESGPDALELAEVLLKDGYDLPLVIADYIMPMMTGDKVLIGIHRMSPLTLTVMLTGQAALDGMTNAINHANLFRYLEKPWNTEELKYIASEAIDTYLRRQRITAENQGLITRKMEIEEQVQFTNGELNKKYSELGSRLQSSATDEAENELLLIKEFSSSLSRIKVNLALTEQRFNPEQSCAKETYDFIDEESDAQSGLATQEAEKTTALAREIFAKHAESTGKGEP